uniref:D-isomer specific 2-hydroxyacid dehydrogenase NAD-binding domain-containing protein n=1 Tax=Triticum urartu TaxID=4572 RepID=A0A8R7TC21_TRIUA
GRWCSWGSRSSRSSPRRWPGASGSFWSRTPTPRPWRRGGRCSSGSIRSRTTTWPRSRRSGSWRASPWASTTSTSPPAGAAGSPSQNAGAAFAVDTADYGVGLVVAVLRRLAAAEAHVRAGRWAADGDYPLTTKVSGKRVGILGLGNIGSRIARRLAAFGCAVSYNSRSPKPSARYEFVPTVRELAAGSDVLVLSCALTEETKHVVNREVMEALGKDGVLVNVGRGGLVDEPELVRCLQEGVVGGAGLDVFESEPNVPPELFSMDNVVLSAHRAVATPESIRGTIELVAGNLDAFFAGKPLLSPVQL